MGRRIAAPELRVAFSRPEAGAARGRRDPVHGRRFSRETECRDELVPAVGSKTTRRAHSKARTTWSEADRFRYTLRYCELSRNRSLPFGRDCPERQSRSRGQTYAEYSRG